ncbi:MAG: ABC transporter substrate-binding protein [Candidatus Rokubacteria bacterium]|nr:ABC transporter substrate-binding protein [Candidatus Rokubacteria bacterium]
MSISRRQFLKTSALAAGGTALPRVAAGQPKEILLAAVVALTGPNAAWGQRTWNGFQLSCDLVNEQGGVKSLGGAKLKYMVADTESKPEVAGSQTERVIQRGAVAITGTNQSAATIVATQIAEREGVPFVCATDVDPLITSRGFKYTFRTSPLVDAYARDLLSYVKELGEKSGKPARKLAVLSENSIVGQSSVEGAKRVAKELGFEVVDADTYDAAKTQNFAPYVSRYKGAGVEVVIGHNKPNDAVLITRAMKELAFNPMAYGGILGGHVSTEYVNALGKDADHVLATTSWSADADIRGLKELAQKYQARFKEPMDSTSAGGFTAFSVLWDALERAGSADRKKLRDAIAATQLKTGDRMYMQLRGAKFQPSGENSLAGGLVFTIRDKKWLTVAPKEFAKATATYPKPKWGA